MRKMCGWEIRKKINRRVFSMGNGTSSVCDGAFEMAGKFLVCFMGSKWREKSFEGKLWW